MEASAAEVGSRRVPPRAPARASIMPLGAPAAYGAELVGTFMLVFVIVMVLSVSNGLGYADFAVIGLAHVVALFLAIVSLGGASGGHFNPAVTVAIAALRKIAPVDAAIYIGCQLVGAVLATLLVKLLIKDEAEAAKYGANLVSEDKFLDGSAGKALIAEAVATFFLMWAIMATAVNPRGNRNWAPFVIGMTLGGMVFILGPLTGASLNPARSFGPALVDGTFTDAWFWIIGPVLGAILAAILYTALVLVPQDRVGERPIDKLD